MTGDWHHAPSHRLEESGTYFITAGTHQKRHLFRSRASLDHLVDRFFFFADKHALELEAWAWFSNHYHFIARAPEAKPRIREMIHEMHTATANELNEMDGAPGRRVWYQYWDTHLTYEKSYLARLRYVHENAVHHGLVPVASQYPWCSAAWFEREASPSFVRTVNSFKIDRLNVFDPYDTVLD